MHAKTALAVAGSVLAVPSAALAANHAPDSDALHPSGKLTHDEGLKDGLVRTNVRLSRRLDRKPRVRRLQTLSVSVLRQRNRGLRTRVSRLKPATPPYLQAIAACESGGNPSAIGGGGTYRGKYQFDYGTWSSVGGSGDPAAAPEAEQDKRAAMLYSRTGASSWPVCGR
jgi:Transglycosylase-like domain